MGGWLRRQGRRGGGFRGLGETQDGTCEVFRNFVRYRKTVGVLDVSEGQLLCHWLGRFAVAEIVSVVGLHK